MVIAKRLKRKFDLSKYKNCGCLMQGNQGVTDEGMVHVGQMWGLKSLELQFCWQLTDKGW